MPEFRLIARSSTDFARAGSVTTHHGAFQTPCYLPVATFGAVKLIGIDDLVDAGAPLLLGNALHLEMTAGSQEVQALGGLAKFMGWNGPTLTDSGGYQVSYMWRSGTHSLEQGERRHAENSPVERIDDAGVRVRSSVSGRRYEISPESAMEIQARLGADFVMAFDQPTFDTDSVDAARATLARSQKWTQRSLRHWRSLRERCVAPSWQEFIPIVQGGRHRELRRASCAEALEMGCDFLAVAGESIGIDPRVSAETLESIQDLLPLTMPLYAMGLGGGPEGFFAAVARGVDMFDNTSPTRLGRSGLAFVRPESGGRKQNKFRIDLTKRIYARDESPIDERCTCKSCRRYTRAYLRHLLKIREPLGMGLVSYHNVFFMCKLSSAIRDSIIGDSFRALAHEWLDA